MVGPAARLGIFAAPIGRIMVFALAVATLAAVPAPLAAQGAYPQVVNRGVENRRSIRTYTHPKLGFSLVMPDKSNLFERREGAGVLIQSPRGYTINIQTGPVDPALSLAQRMEKLEIRDLGPGKRWSRKMGSRQTTVNGRPAFEALYQGPSESARVTLIRGARIDYVFIYLASPETYAISLGEYFAVLTSFKPSAAPVDPPPRFGGQANQKAGGRASLEPARRAAIIAAEPAPATPDLGRVKMFAAPDFGVTMTYPETWVAKRSTPFSALFSGPPGSDAFYATIRIDRVSLPPSGDNKVALASVFADQKAQINSGTRNPAFFSETSYRYDKSNVRVTGHEMVVAFSYRLQRFRRWLIVLPHPAGGEAIIWTYTAPDAAYDKYRQTARKMLRSLRFANPRLASSN